MELNKPTHFSELNKIITDINEINLDLSEDNKETLTLFVSFDIVNSTNYKLIDKKRWSTAISAIMRRIISSFSNSPTGGYSYWKTLGDEIIYTHTIRSVQHLQKSLEEIYTTLVLLNQKITTGELFESIGSDILTIKSSVWLADISPSPKLTDNILTYYQINDKRMQADFIGPDIDTGFRISKHSLSNRMLISFDIAYLLLKYKDILKEQGGLQDFNFSNRVHILSCEKLKGVWNSTPYPIMLYHGDTHKSFNASITEYEKQNFEIIQKYLKTQNTANLSGTVSYCTQEDTLNNLYHSMKLANKINRLIDLMESTGSFSNQTVKELKLVSYSAVSYTITDEKINFIIIKDNTTGLWGFGVAEFFYTDHFVYQTEKTYRELYNLDIHIENNNKREKIPLVISSTHFFNDHNTYIKRSVFLGKLEKFNTQRTNIKLISEDDINLFKEDTITLFHEILQLCSKKIHEIDWEHNATRIKY